MEKAVAERGKVAETEKKAWGAGGATHVAGVGSWPVVRLAALAADRDPIASGAASAAAAKNKEPMAPIVGQKRRKKKKNKKSRKRRPGAVQIKHPKEVPAFDEFDSDDAVEEEFSDEVASDKDSRDEKSRHVLKRFMAGYIPYLRSPGRYKCPFCVRDLPEDHAGMLQHAKGIGGGCRTTAPHVMAKHAAHGMFLEKLAAKGKGV